MLAALRLATITRAFIPRDSWQRKRKKKKRACYDIARRRNTFEDRRVLVSSTFSILAKSAEHHICSTRSEATTLFLVGSPLVLSISVPPLMVAM